MNISSATSSLSAYTNTSAQASQSQKAQQPQEAKAVESRESRLAERVEFKEEAPKPVTNTLGQKTGSLINITA